MMQHAMFAMQQSTYSDYQYDDIKTTGWEGLFDA